MAILYNNSASSAYAISSGRTYAITTSGVNRFLIIWVWNDDYAGAGDKITGITYNGVSLTRINGGLTGLSQYTSTWYLVNPSIGTNNIIISSSDSCGIKSMASSYTGVAQTSPIDANVFEAISTASLAITTKSITVGVDNCWVIGGVHQNWNALSINSGVTSRVSSDVYSNIGDSNAPVLSGSYSISYNAATNAGGYTTYHLVSIKQEISSTSSSNFLMFF